MYGNQETEEPAIEKMLKQYIDYYDPYYNQYVVTLNANDYKIEIKLGLN